MTGVRDTGKAPRTTLRVPRETKNVFIKIRLEASVHQQLQRAARNSQRTLAGEIRMACQEHLAKLDLENAA